MAEIVESSSGKGQVRIKLHAKLKALEMLGRHLGMFTLEGTKGDDSLEEPLAPLSPELTRRIEMLFPTQEEATEE